MKTNHTLSTLAHIAAIGACVATSSCGKSDKKNPAAGVAKADAAVVVPRDAAKGPAATVVPGRDTPFMFPSVAGQSRATNPDPWKTADIGTVGDAKAALTLYTHTNESQSFFLRAGGTDIGGAADSCGFVFQPVKGDAEIWVYLRSLTMVDDLTRAGIMIREGTDPGAPMVFLGTNGNGGAGGTIIARLTQGAPAIAQPAPGEMPAVDDRLKTGKWMKLVRVGDVITAYAGTRSTVLKVASVKLALSRPDAELLFGLAAVSHSGKEATFVDAGNLQISNLFANPATKALELHDVGSLGATALSSGSTIKITGWGQPWGVEKDNFREYFSYVFRATQGEDSVRVKIESLKGGAGSAPDPEAKVGLMFRAADGAPPEISFNIQRNSFGLALSVTPDKGLQLHARVSKTVNDGYIDMLPIKTMAGIKAPVWLKLDKSVTRAQMVLPNGFQATETKIKVVASYAMPAGDGTPGAWTVLGESSFPFGDNALTNLGVHVTSFNADKLVTAEVSGLTFAPTGGGMPPSGPRPDAGAPPGAGQGVDASRDMRRGN